MSDAVTIGGFGIAPQSTVMSEGTAFKIGGSVSTVQVTVLVAVAVLPQASVVVKVLV
jgi:hypothetical protein